MMPIPKSLLIHSCELITELAGDKWGNAKGASESLSNVRIEPSARTAKDSAGVTVQLSAMLFFDCKNSMPNSAVFKLPGDGGCERQAVIFEGRRYVVGSVDRLYDGRRLHHLEVGLI